MTTFKNLTSEQFEGLAPRPGERLYVKPRNVRVSVDEG